jgi:hypothetical protein
MKDKLFELDDVLEALDLEYEDQFFWADRCEITDKGFFPIPLTARDRELLSGGPELAEIRKLLRNLKLELPCTRGQLIEWAERCGFDDALPDEFFDEPEPQAEAPAVEIVSQSAEGKKRTRKINLRRAIESAVDRLRIKLGKKPSIDELWDYFENDRDETGFIEDCTDTHLSWRDTKGNIKDTPKSTVANHLSRIKV